MKALEELGKLTTLEQIRSELGDREFMKIAQDKTVLQNFKGQTIKQLYLEHGGNVKLLVQDGKFYAVLPSFNQFCNNIRDNKVKIVSDFTVNVAAYKDNVKINIVELKGLDS